MRLIDRTGQRFGRLVYVRPVKSGTLSKWEAICDCGTTVVIHHGQRQSCGCWRRDINVARNTTHGMTYTPEYVNYHAMKQRCYYKGSRSYARYGGAGVTVCDRWLESFANFMADMGPKPSPQHTIERINSRGNYGPSNCRWSTRDEQAKNRPAWCVMVQTRDGRSVTLKDLARENGANYGTLRSAVERDEDALLAAERLGRGERLKTGPKVA